MGNNDSFAETRRFLSFIID